MTDERAASAAAPRVSAEAEALAQAVANIRRSVTLTINDHVAMASVSGPGAFELVDRVCARDLFVRDSQILHTVFLDERGNVWADVEICRDDETLQILAEGIDSTTLCDYLTDNRPSGVDATVVDLSKDQRMLAINGVYAWELLSDLAGPEVVGLPYLTFFEGEGWTCYRAGKTGEYGYYLLTPADKLESLHERIAELGARFDMGIAGIDAIDQCQLENGFLCMRARDVTSFTPIELQQQWRVTYRKEYLGSQALLERRAAGITQRTTHVVSGQQISVDDHIYFEDQPVGRLLQTGYSAIRGDWVGLAMLDLRFAHPGLEILSAGHDSTDARVPLSTISAPALNNRSLYVNPQNHSYFTRDEEQHPPLVMDASWILSATGP